MYRTLVLLITMALCMSYATAGPAQDAYDVDKVGRLMEDLHLDACTGGVPLSFTVSTTGRAINPRIDTTVDKYDTVAQCVMSKLSQVRFPKRLANRLITVEF